MHKLLKFTTACATAGLSIAVFTTVAMASETDVVNTGDDVSVHAGSTSSTNVVVSNNNSAVINQSSVSNVNTGYNQANRNIGNTSIETGNAQVANSLKANANSNATSIKNVGGGSDDHVSLTNTGDDVRLSGLGGNSTNVAVANHNVGYVNQFAGSNVNTGYNDANRNIGDTSIDTGNANVTNVFSTNLNANQTNISGLSHGHGDDLDIINTGDDLRVGCRQLRPSVTALSYTQNGNHCGDELNVLVTNNNVAFINQASYSSVNTGGNTANRNIAEDGDISVETGHASVGNAFSVAANSNVTGISGHGLLGNHGDSLNLTNTGDDVRVYGAGTHAVTNVLVSNFNNAAVNQTTCNEVNTGDNVANRNIGLWGAGTGINSGNAMASAAFLAAANFNWTGIGGSFAMPSTWWML